MSNQKIDIIIPVYNDKPGYLKEAIDSCIQQTYKPNKIIVYNDGSNQDYSFVQKIDSRIEYISNSVNLGPGAARNNAAKYSDANFLSFIDADDIMDINKLAYSMLEFTKNKKTAMTCGNYRVFLNRKNIMNQFYRTPPIINHRSLLITNFVASGSVTIRKQVFDELNGFDERFSLAEDYSLWLRVSEKYHISYIHKVLYYYSVLKNSKSLTQNPNNKFKMLEIVKSLKAESEERVRKNVEYKTAI